MRLSGEDIDKMISIHALREEGDEEIPYSQYTVKEFLSTPSARRATFFDRYDDPTAGISIHALREEGDRARP